MSPPRPDTDGIENELLLADMERRGCCCLLKQSLYHLFCSLCGVAAGASSHFSLEDIRRMAQV